MKKIQTNIHIEFFNGKRLVQKAGFCSGARVQTIDRRWQKFVEISLPHLSWLPTFDNYRVSFVSKIDETVIIRTAKI